MQFQCGERKYFVTAEFEDNIDHGKECRPSCAAGDPATGDGASVGNPILVTSGQKVEVATDYKSAAPGGLLLVRYYTSGASGDEGLGIGWRHTYMRKIIDVYTKAPPPHDPANPRHSLLYNSPNQACIQGWSAIKDEVTGLDGENTSAQWISDPEHSLEGYCQLRYNGTARGRIKIYDNVNTRPAFVPELSAKRITMGNGRVLTFNRVNGQWKSDPDIPARLVETTDGFELHTSADTVESFDRNGRLVSITDRQGRKTNLTYSNGRLETVTDAYGRTLTFNYGVGGLIASVGVPGGTLIGYEYGPDNNLSAVVYPDETPATSADNPRVQLHYENSQYPHALTGLTDERGERFATWTYDDLGRAISSEHAAGIERMDLSILSDRKVRVTDSLGAETLYSFELLHGTRRVKKLERQACDTCPVHTRSFTYDANGFIASRTDFNGNITMFVHNDRGLETSRTEAAGTAYESTVTTHWHPDFRLPTRIEEPGRRTDYTYDANGNRLTTTITDTTTGKSRTTAWTYNAKGLVTSTDGPRTDVSDITTYNYDAKGHLTTITNALGHVTRIAEHDAHGNPLRLIDPNGVETKLSYDARQRLTSRSVDGATTRFDYDEAGQLIAVKLPSEATLHYEYDAARRLIAIEDNDGNRVEYTLNAVGNRTSQEIRDVGGTLRYAQQQIFDQLSQLKEILGNNGQSTRYDYDANSNRTAVTEAGLYSTLRQFDALDRLTKVSDAGSGETLFEYDALGNLVSVTDPEGLTTSYTYNAFGNLVELDSPDTGVTAYAYDKAGNRISQTDARGITVTYSHDALNRPIRADYPGADVDTVYHYDGSNYATNQPNGIGRLTGTEKSGGTILYVYGSRGNLIRQTMALSGETYDTSYEYDANDNVIRIVYPSGRTIDYQRDVSGRVVKITATVQNRVQTLAEQIVYLPFGGIQSLTLGNGQSVDMNYDLDYRLTAKRVPGLFDLQWDYDARNNITAITDASGRIQDQQFVYDALSRLTQAQGAYGTISYTYDSVGNRLSRTIDGNSETYTYAPDSHRLQSVADSSGTTTYTYDSAGNTLTKGNEREYSYDAAGRLVQVDESNTSYLDNLRYNAFGQRFYADVVKQKHRQDKRRGKKKHYNRSGWKRSQNRSEIYLYDPQGRLIAEMSGTRSKFLREYVYLDGIPLAMLGRQPRHKGVSYFHTDHLGTPQLLSDSAGRVVWQGRYKPFGDVTVTVSTVENPLRFSGQRDDGASEIYYNYFRDYNPATGRYVTSDPIGLAGGLNTYGYGLGNPVSTIDPFGLEVYVHSRNVQGTLGAGAHTYVTVVNQDGVITFGSYKDDKGKNDTRINDPSDHGLGRLPRTSTIEVLPPDGMTQSEWDSAVIRIGKKTAMLPSPDYDAWGGDGIYRSGNCHTTTRRIINDAGGSIPSSYDPPGLNPGLHN